MYNEDSLTRAVKSAILLSKDSTYTVKISRYVLLRLDGVDHVDSDINAGISSFSTPIRVR